MIKVGPYKSARCELTPRGELPPAWTCELGNGGVVEKVEDLRTIAFERPTPACGAVGEINKTQSFAIECKPTKEYPKPVFSVKLEKNLLRIRSV